MNTDKIQEFRDARAAVDRLTALYTHSIQTLKDGINAVASGSHDGTRIRAYYPMIRVQTDRFVIDEPRQSSGYLSGPGQYETTITRPDLFRLYLIEQIESVMVSHDIPVEVGYSKTPIPIHFALDDGVAAEFAREADEIDLRNIFDVPDLATTNDAIVNGEPSEGPDPLAPFTAQRVDYSLARLKHYTATDPEHFQSFVLFTNYQFYVDEFERFARAALADNSTGYVSFVGSGNVEIFDANTEMPPLAKMPQMPSYYLKRADGSGITLVNIGVGPSNAKTATDHIAVLRPHAWLMLGHCAGLRNSQALGDFVLGHA